MERKTYDAESLRRGMREFENAYSMSSDDFFAAYVERRHVEGVPGFDAHVWASFVEDVRRMEADSTPLQRATRAFAHAA